MSDLNLAEVIQHIDPMSCDYNEWCSVGMALKEEGYDVRVWDEWSRSDSLRYHDGECEKKWNTFGTYAFSQKVTGGTIVQMAKERGWQPRSARDEELDWNSEIGKDDYVVIDKGYLEPTGFHEPTDNDFHPAEEVIRYLETLFLPDETIGYVTDCWEKDDGKLIPTAGAYTRTAGELLQALRKNKNDIGAVLGDYNPKAGAWIRFNPLDGKGVKNENVTEFRYALVESDNMELEQQNTLLRELELPIAVLVYSGGKSLHAIVKIDAVDFREYQKRVEYLYNICTKNGMTIDRKNKNPSRLSRFPGFFRGEHKQFILDTNIGKQTWEEWVEWIEGINDNLPEPESISEVWDNLPELSPPLIEGILRQGHKMLLAGPSKAGKSYALIELCCAIAEGQPWLQFQCTKGKVLYVNVELDRASCLHRFKDVYSALGWKPNNLQNIDIWNLRGKSIPMDQLAPKLIRRAAKKNYIAVIIDPIYKVITGDENSAEQMSNFCNQFDKVCTELGCAVIYCHHHSKGDQGGKKSMDRASGSGVFARDPDALLDLIELELNDDIREVKTDRMICALTESRLQRFSVDLSVYSRDDLLVRNEILKIAERELPGAAYKRLCEEIMQLQERSAAYSAWRIEATLREFPKPPGMNFWFEYPVHREDETGALKDIELEPTWNKTWKKNFKKKSAAERKSERKESVLTAFEACAMGESSVPIADLAQYMGVSEKTVRSRLKEHGNFWIDGGETGLKNEN